MITARQNCRKRRIWSGLMNMVAVIRAILWVWNGICDEISSLVRRL